MFIIGDILWLDTIVEKLAWKHRVFTSEVEEVLTGQCRIYRKETGSVDGEHLYNALAVCGKTQSLKADQKCSDARRPRAFHLPFRQAIPRVASRRIRSDFLPRRRVGESARGVLGRTPQ
jgi:hypothetical protein